MKKLSLQSQLIKNALYSSILAGLLAWLLFLGVSVYQTMSMHDEWMQEIAELLVGDVTQGRAAQVDVISEQFEIEYQLYYDNELLTHSDVQESVQKIRVRPENKFQFQFQDGKIFRSYYLDQDGLRAVVVQPLAIRIHELWRASLGFLGVLILLWLIQSIFLKVVIQRQLKPLINLSDAIADKSAQDLRPIQRVEPDVKELQPIIQQLNAMLARVEKSLEAEQRFTADASHELRSPLSAMQMRLQVLQRKYQSYEQLPQDIALLQKDLTRGVQVLENLLLLARLDPEQPENLQKTAFEFSAHLHELIQALQPFWNDKDLDWKIEVNTTMLWVNVDLMIICLRNLLDNAIRYSPEHGQIYIHTRQDEHAVEVIIENAAEHLKPEILPKLGQRFYRVLGTKTQGSGLGLSICKKIIELHDAEIRFEPSSLGGLKVILIFPKSLNHHI